MHYSLWAAVTMVFDAFHTTRSSKEQLPAIEDCVVVRSKKDNPDLQSIEVSS